MLPIVFMILVFIICYVLDFPGGPTGFAVCTKSWLKQKRLARKSKSFQK